MLTQFFFLSLFLLLLHPWCIYWICVSEWPLVCDLLYASWMRISFTRQFNFNEWMKRQQQRKRRKKPVESQYLMDFFVRTAATADHFPLSWWGIYYINNCPGIGKTINYCTHTHSLLLFGLKWRIYRVRCTGTRCTCETFHRMKKRFWILIIKFMLNWCESAGAGAGANAFPNAHTHTSAMQCAMLGRTDAVHHLNRN